MYITDLFEKQVAPTRYVTKYKTLYHLTDGYGLGISVETDTLKSLRQNYISTTYRKETNSILGRQSYYYKFILDGKKLAKNYGVFPYDHQLTSIGLSSREVVSADEAEIGVNTKEISPLSEYLLGVVILTKPYSQHQILFLADINTNSRGTFDVQKSETIHAITALNLIKVPLYWQEENRFIPLSEKDHQYLRDIEKFMHVIENKNRPERHFDLLEMLLDKYDITSDDLIRGKEHIDKQMIHRKRQIPKIIDTLNAYFEHRPKSKILHDDLKTMMIDFLKAMRYGNNVIGMIIAACEEYNFFHPVVAPVEWTSVIDDLVKGQIESAIENIKESEPPEYKVQSYEDGYGKNSSHYATGMSEM